MTGKTLVDIGGRKLAHFRSGMGIPTVILEAGLGDSLEVWEKIQDAVSEFTSVCSYDRAGQGQSDPAPTPRTCQDMVADLHNLLTNAKLPPPYVLVGHSFGGMIMRLFAHQYPREVTGMVLVDAVHEDRDIGFEAVMSEDLIQRNRTYLQHPERNSENVDKLASADQLRATWRIYDFPIYILTRGKADEDDPIWPSAALQKVERDLQGEFLKLSSKSNQVIDEKSGHYIQVDNPELVIDAIRQVTAGK